MTSDELAKLSDHVEHFIMLEMGRRLPYVGILIDPELEKFGLALFTNRRSNDEVRMILEEALEGLKRSADQFKVMDGKVCR